MTLDPGFSDEVTGLGDALRDARLGRALSLDECQRATRISQRYLQALEEEDFGALPAPVFARGFLRSYAQFLGLDPVMLLQRFPAQRPLRDTLPGSDFSNSSQLNAKGFSVNTFFPELKHLIIISACLFGRVPISTASISTESRISSRDVEACSAP